jgi:hypothetical protein
VIDHGKHLQTFFRESGLQAPHCFLDRKTTGDLNKSILSWHVYLPRNCGLEDERDALPAARKFIRNLALLASVVAT